MTHSDKMDRKTGAGIQKPNGRLDYNKTISGIDLASRMVIPYSK